MKVEEIFTKREINKMKETAMEKYGEVPDDDNMLPYITIDTSNFSALTKHEKKWVDYIINKEKRNIVKK